MAAAINALRDKTHHHLGSSSPTPEDHSIRQEVGTFRQHTNNEVKRINKELGELKEHNLKLHHLHREQMRQKATADAAALCAEEADVWGFAAHDVHLVCSPLHHSVAIRFSAGTLLAGGSVVLLRRFDAAAAARAVAEHAVTTTFMVPAHLQRLFARGTLPDLSSFRLLAHAGAPCPAPLKRAASAHWTP